MQMVVTNAKGTVRTVAEVATELRLHPSSVYRKIAAGHLPAFRTGSHRAALRIPADYKRHLLGVPDDGSSAGDSFAGADPAERRGTQAMRGQSNPSAHAGREQ
jgi:excisionase family DNA binding protein